MKDIAAILSAILSWPVALFFIVIIFKQPLNGLIARIKEIRSGDVAFLLDYERFKEKAHDAAGVHEQRLIDVVREAAMNIQKFIASEGMTDFQVEIKLSRKPKP